MIATRAALACLLVTLWSSGARAQGPAHGGGASWFRASAHRAEVQTRPGGRSSGLTSDEERARVEQDLWSLKKAIALHDAREPRPLSGTDLSPLLGQYLQQLPADPWGRTYLFDGFVGVLASFGLDGLPGGDGHDQDQHTWTRPPLMVNRAQYQGRWGRPIGAKHGVPTQGNCLIVSLTSPVAETDPAATPGDLDLLINNHEPDVPPVPLGAVVWARQGGEWRSSAHRQPRDPRHQPGRGLVVLYWDGPPEVSRAGQSVTPTMALDLHASSRDPDRAALSSLTPIHAPSTPDAPSPVDPEHFGLQAPRRFHRAPMRTEPIRGIRRGVRLEKY